MTQTRYLSPYILGLTALSSLAVLGGCKTVPEPVPVIEEIAEPIIVQPVRTCIPVHELERVVVPAEIKRGTAISSVENTPQFITDPVTGEVRDVTPPPQEVAVPFERVITPEYVYYVNGEGKVINDICEDEPVDSLTITPEITQ